MRVRAALLLCSALLPMLGILGCASSGYLGPRGTEFPIPAMKLQDVVKKALDGEFGVPVDQSSGGFVQSAWEEHVGKEHGILLWRRAWPARTRYRIQITPSFEKPMQSSVIDIESETQERPNDSYPWAAVDLDYGPKRCAKLLSIIRRIVMEEGNAT